MLLSSGLVFGMIVGCEPPGSPPEAGQDTVAGLGVRLPAPRLELASYDDTLQVPRCSAGGAGCDSDTLLDGRGKLGPEPHMPNTLGGRCLDGSAGTYHSDESIDRIRVYTTDGSALAPGKAVTLEVTLWAYSVGNRVDLYVTEDASNPSWKLFKVLAPPGPGPSTLKTPYTLPAHVTGMQAVRAVIRYTGASTSCDGDGYNDWDDLAFQVSASPCCLAPSPP